MKLCILIKKLHGFALPLSTSNILKSSTYENVDTIVFDEFLLDKGNYHYLYNEPTKLLDLIETIARLRDIRVILLGNAITVTNPYFSYFNISLPYNSEYKLFNDGLILVNYIKNLEYRKTKENTRFGKLIKNTNYGKYAIDNQFLQDNNNFVKKRPSHSKFFYTFILNGEKFGIWQDNLNDCIYVSRDYDPNNLLTYTLSLNDHNEKTIFLKTTKSQFVKILATHYEYGKLFFENINIKNIFLNYLQKLL